jgi:hypothetical protein
VFFRFTITLINTFSSSFAQSDRLRVMGEAGYSGPHCQDRKRVKIKSHHSFLPGKLVFGWLTDIDELEEN